MTPMSPEEERNSSKNPSPMWKKGDRGRIPTPPRNILEIFTGEAPLFSLILLPVIVDYKRMSDLFDDNIQSMRALSSPPCLLRDDEEQIWSVFQSFGNELNPFTTSDLTSTLPSHSAIISTLS